MLNPNNNQLKILLDLGLEAEAKKFAILVSGEEKNYFLFDLVKQYLKLFNFDVAITLANSIKSKELKEFAFKLIIQVYFRGYLSNSLNQKIDHNLIQRIKKHIKIINEKYLPKLNQRIKVINLTLELRIDEIIEIIERMAQRDKYLVVSILIDLLNLGNGGYQVLWQILRTSTNYELKQICYHLFKHHGGQKAKDKIKQYKSETTIIMIHGNENYKFKKFKQENKITYQRIKREDNYKIPKFIINKGKIIDIEIVRQLFLSHTFIVFTKPYSLLLKCIKKDPYLQQIPVIYPVNNSEEEIASDGLIKLYQPSEIYLENFSKQGLNQEETTEIIEQNMYLFIEDMLAQI